jgi:hypothetical protein
MKAILIDVNNKEINEVDYSGDFRDIYKFINCDCFTVVNIDKNNVVYVDDEGLLKGNKNFFKGKFYPQELAGNGLILGSDSMGESVDTSITVSEVEDMITFIDFDKAPKAPSPLFFTF